MSEATRTVNAESLGEIVRQIIEAAEPEQIILFGSAVRGGMGRNSDVDLLVVKAGANRLALAQRIYARLGGVAEAVDVIVVTPEDVDRYRHNPALVIAAALEEGKVVYDARKTPAG